MSFHSHVRPRRDTTQQLPHVEHYALTNSQTLTHACTHTLTTAYNHYTHANAGSIQMFQRHPDAPSAFWSIFISVRFPICRATPQCYTHSYALAPQSSLIPPQQTGYAIQKVYNIVIREANSNSCFQLCLGMIVSASLKNSSLFHRVQPAGARRLRPGLWKCFFHLFH